MLDWKIGDKIVCIKAFTFALWFGEDRPQMGDVYTIRSINPGYEEYNSDFIFVRLNEIINPPCRLINKEFIEVQFISTHFEKVIERKTDISVFQTLLTPAPKEVVKPVHRRIKENV